MRNRVATSIAAGLLLAGAALAQAPAAKAQFEVATVKPAGPLDPQKIMAGKMKVGMNWEGSRVEFGFLSLAYLIQYAYKMKQHQVVVPDWAKTERFEIVAKLPEGATKEQGPEMMQGLLAERFGLTFHKESREQNVFGLLVAKGGHKLKESSTEAEAPLGEEKKGESTISLGGTQIRQGGGNSFTVTSKEMEGKMKMQMVDGKMRMEFTKAKIEMLTEFVTRFVGKPVVDMTELTGKYDITVEMTMQEMMAMARTAGMAIPGMMPGGPAPGGDARPADAASDPSAGGTIMASLQSMGLRLESRKAPVDTLIVDKLEKAPTEN